MRRVWRLVHGWTGIFRRGRFCNILCEIYCNKGVISDHFLLHTPDTDKYERVSVVRSTHVKGTHAILDPSYFNAGVEAQENCTDRHE